MSLAVTTIGVREEMRLASALRGRSRRAVPQSFVAAKGLKLVFLNGVLQHEGGDYRVEKITPRGTLSVSFLISLNRQDRIIFVSEV